MAAAHERERARSEGKGEHTGRSCPRRARRDVAPGMLDGLMEGQGRNGAGQRQRSRRSAIFFGVNDGKQVALS